jgi:hypothetical protein
MNRIRQFGDLDRQASGRPEVGMWGSRRVNDRMPTFRTFGDELK